MLRFNVLCQVINVRKLFFKCCPDNICMFSVCKKHSKLIQPNGLGQVRLVRNVSLTVVLLMPLCEWCPRMTEKFYEPKIVLVQARKEYFLTVVRVIPICVCCSRSTNKCQEQLQYCQVMHVKIFCVTVALVISVCLLCEKPWEMVRANLILSGNIRKQYFV